MSNGKVIRTNLDSLFNMTRPVINGMRDRSFGRVINISSINGAEGARPRQLLLGQGRRHRLYPGARAGKCAEGRHGERHRPGYVATEFLAGVSDEVMKSIVGQIPVGRLGEADEVARCVTFLAADDAGWITGSTLTINGGQHID